MTIVLAAVQFATDIIPMFTGSDSFMKPGQMVMAKHVSTVRTLTGKAPTFTQKEIADVRHQPFVSDVGTFTPSLFSVVATLGSQKLGVEFSTEMFFEAITMPLWMSTSPAGIGKRETRKYLSYCPVTT